MYIPGKSFHRIISKQRQLKDQREQLVNQLDTLDRRLKDEFITYKNLQSEHDDLKNVIKSILAPINALTGRNLQLEDLDMKDGACESENELL